MRILAVGASGQVGWEPSKGGAQPGLDILALDHAALDIADSTAVDRTVKDTKPSLVVNAALLRLTRQNRNQNWPLWRTGRSCKDPIAIEGIEIWQKRQKSLRRLQ